MKRFVTAAAVSAAALMGTTAFTQAADVEVIHWWTSGGEQAAKTRSTARASRLILR